MYYTNWKNAINIALSYQNFEHVTLIMFTDPDCEVCNEFIPKLVNLENPWYKVVIVNDGRDMPFPPTFYPVGYVYIPNSPSKMPMIRQGNAPIDIMLKDSALQIDAMKQGRDYLELKEESKK